MEITVLDQIPVAPPPEATAKLTLPLTFLDLLWLPMSPVHRLIFYKHPISRTHFVDSLIPMMKNSLSLSLHHYSPLAGRLILSPDDSILPEIRYVDGNTVPLVLAECISSEGQFNHLVSDGAKSCTDSHPLVPSLPPTSRLSDGSVAVPVLALQVTLFPDVGICVGVTNHHVVGDASSIFGFMKAWAFFSSHADQNSTSSSVSLPSEFRPFYDRAGVKDGKGLGAIFWNNVKNIKIEETHVHRLPSITNKVRATFTVTRDYIQRLKNSVLARRPNLVYISSFTVTCSYVWKCVVQSRYDPNNENEDEIFGFAADCRARLDPPLPGNYFGNCVTGCLGFGKAKQLVGEDGLVEAADVIGESIRSQLYNKEEGGVFRGAEDWFTLVSTLNMDRTLSVAGSPKFDYYELNFGWGKPDKFEIPSIDVAGAISLSASKDHDGGLEIGLSLPVTQMDTFAGIFAQGLKAL